MPRGVGKDFLLLLQGEHDAARARLLVFLALGLLLLVPAWFLWQPLGPAVHVAGWLVGLGVGALAGMRTSRTYEDSLRGTWNRWMRLAPACETVPELARKVRGRSGVWRTAWVASGLTILWCVELLLLALAFVDVHSAAYAVPVIATNGLLVGVVSGHHIRLLTWTRSFRRSLDEMVRAGEIGVWGAVG